MQPQPAIEFNPYQPPESALDDALSSAEIAMISKFVGARSGYYTQRWSLMRSVANAKGGFNTAALLYGPLWFLYRRMYFGFLLIVAILLSVGWVEHALFGFSLSDFSNPLKPSLIIDIAISAMIARSANRFYFEHSCKKIRSLRKKDLSASKTEQWLKHAGGTNWLIPSTLVVSLVLISLSALYYGVV